MKVTRIPRNVHYYCGQGSICGQTLRHCEAHTFFVRVLHVILLVPVRTDIPTNTVPGCIPVTSTLRHP